MINRLETTPGKLYRYRNGRAADQWVMVGAARHVDDGEPRYAVVLRGPDGRLVCGSPLQILNRFEPIEPLPAVGCQVPDDPILEAAPVPVKVAGEGLNATGDNPEQWRVNE